MGIATILAEENKQFMQAVVGESKGENSKVKVKTTYAERLEELDWENAYCDSVQMKINYKEEEPVYAMVDGRMLLTREEKWKEIKVGRVFGGNSLVEVSKRRNIAGPFC